MVRLENKIKIVRDGCVFLKGDPKAQSPAPVYNPQTKISSMNVNLKHYVKLTIKRRIVMHLEGSNTRQQNVGSS